MRLPPWAIEAIRNGVADVARKASDAETITKVKQQAAELLRDLPENASRGIDAIVRTATETARGALDQGRESVLRWTERQTELAVRCLNVTGVLHSQHGSGVAVSDHVLQLGCDIMRGDCVEQDLAIRLNKSLSKLLDVDGCSLAVANNLDAAVAAVGVLADGRKMVLHRSQAIRLPSGMPLPDAFPGITLTECGGVQAIEPSDFDGIDQACVILADDGIHPIQPIDFGGRENLSIAIIPIATICQSYEGVPSAEALLESGIDLVVMSGGPLGGGPNAGILAGKKSLIESIVKNLQWKTYAASHSIAAMTLASMTAPQPSPISVLIETAEENLRSRAERLATRLTADESITACQITDQKAVLVAGGRWQFPSRQLRLRHKSLSAENWAAKLRLQNPAVMASIDGADLLIDLRWLAASEDSTVAEALGSIDPPDSPAKPDSESSNV